MTGRGTMGGGLRWPALVLIATIAVTSCSRNDSVSSSVSHSGSVAFDLKLSSMAEITTVTYRITGNGITPIPGILDVTSSNDARAMVTGIPAGTGYTIKLDAVSLDGKTTCTATATFDVVENQTATANVVLLCKATSTLGTGGAPDGGSDASPPDAGMGGAGGGSGLGGATLDASATDLAASGGSGTGGRATGGSATGGSATGGAGTGGAGTGGVGTGTGASTTGGAATGSASTGGASTGGSATGGSATGGAATGGAATGGAATGGAATGGAATGGAATGGAVIGGGGTGGSATGGATSGGRGPGTGGAATGGASSGGSGTGGSGFGGAGGSCVPTHCAGGVCDACTADNCVPATDGCDSITNLADRALCESVYACFVTPAFACVTQGDPLKCWCGTNPTTCVTSNAAPTKANGPCLDLVTTAARLTPATYDAATIKQRFVDPSFPLGRAVNLTSCRGSFCNLECSVP